MRTHDRGVPDLSGGRPGSADPGADAGATDAAIAVASAAADAVALIEHHREELRAVMAELTALQRDVRADLLALAELLQAVPSDGRPVLAEPARRRRRNR